MWGPHQINQSNKHGSNGNGDDSRKFKIVYLYNSAFFCVLRRWQQQQQQQRQCNYNTNRIAIVE